MWRLWNLFRYLLLFWRFWNRCWSLLRLIFNVLNSCKGCFIFICLSFNVFMPIRGAFITICLFHINHSLWINFLVFYVWTKWKTAVVWRWNATSARNSNMSYLWIKKYILTALWNESFKIFRCSFLSWSTFWNWLTHQHLSHIICTTCILLCSLISISTHNCISTIYTLWSIFNN